MSFPALITLPFVYDDPSIEDSDCLPEGLVSYFLEHFTKKGQKVFDPFFGLGSTLFVAEEMGRIPYGVEADGERFEWVAGQLENWQNVGHGDSADMGNMGFPKMDFCLTSPPYMPSHHKWNPLYGGDPDFAGYDNYLTRMEEIFAALRPLMKRGALIVVQVDNLNHGRHYTPLVRDIGNVVTKSFKPVGETIVHWQDHENPVSHCLIFKA